MKAPVEKDLPQMPTTSNFRESRTPVQGARQTQNVNTPTSSQAEIDAAATKHQGDMDAAKKAADAAAIAAGTMGSGPNGAFVPGDPGYKAPSGGGSGSGSGNGASLTAPIGTVDHSTEAGTNAINDILGSLIGFTQAQIDNFYNEYKSGLPLSRIVDDIRQTPQYTQRFPGMAALAKTGNRISEAEYITKENADRTLLQTYLGPSASQYNTTAQLGNLIANNVSTAELQGRLQAANDAVLQADPHTVQWLKDNGLTQGDLTAYWLNPDVALADVQRRANMGQLGGIADSAGFGNISADQAKQLSLAGISNDQAKQGFGQLGLDGQFQQALPGNESPTVTQQQLIDATFNNDANAQAQLNRVRGARVAQFQDNGAFATDSKGVIGLGTANTQ